MGGYGEAEAVHNQPPVIHNLNRIHTSRTPTESTPSAIAACAYQLVRLERAAMTAGIYERSAVIYKASALDWRTPRAP